MQPRNSRQISGLSLVFRRIFGATPKKVHLLFQRELTQQFVNASFIRLLRGNGLGWRLRPGDSANDAESQENRKPSL